MHWSMVKNRSSMGISRLSIDRSRSFILVKRLMIATLNGSVEEEEAEGVIEASSSDIWNRWN
jgi:hypothetical protein